MTYRKHSLKWSYTADCSTTTENADWIWTARFSTVFFSGPTEDSAWTSHWVRLYGNTYIIWPRLVIVNDVSQSDALQIPHRSIDWLKRVLTVKRNDVDVGWSHRRRFNTDSSCTRASRQQPTFDARPLRQVVCLTATQSISTEYMALCSHIVICYCYNHRCSCAGWSITSNSSSSSITVVVTSRSRPLAGCLYIWSVVAT